MRPVGLRRLEVEPGAPVRQRHGGRVAQPAVRVRRRRRRTVRVRGENSVALPRDPRLLEPVLLRARAAVVQHDQRLRAQDRRHARAALIPRARRRAQHVAVPVPRQPVRAGGVGRRHPILLARLRQRVAADPRPPLTCRVDVHDRILHGERVRPGEDDGSAAGRQTGRVVRVDRLDPPVLRPGCRTADVQPPAALRAPDEAWTLEGIRPEAFTLDPGDRLEPLAVLGAGDHGLHAAGLVPLRAGRVTHPVAEPVDAVVEDRVWRAGPVAGASVRRRDDHAPLLHRRQRHDLPRGRDQRHAGKLVALARAERLDASPGRLVHLGTRRRRRASRAPPASTPRATRRSGGTPSSSLPGRRRAPRSPRRRRTRRRGRAPRSAPARRGRTGRARPGSAARADRVRSAPGRTRSPTDSGFAGAQVANASRPPGLSTRRVSRSASAGSGTSMYP